MNCKNNYLNLFLYCIFISWGTEISSNRLSHSSNRHEPVLVDSKALTCNSTMFFFSTGWSPLVSSCWRKTFHQKNGINSLIFHHKKCLFSKCKTLREKRGRFPGNRMDSSCMFLTRSYQFPPLCIVSHLLFLLINPDFQLLLILFQFPVDPKFYCRCSTVQRLMGSIFKIPVICPI